MHTARAVLAVAATAAAVASAQHLTRDQMAKGAGFNSVAEYPEHHELALLDPGLLRAEFEASIANVTASPDTYTNNAPITVTLEVKDVSQLKQGWVGVYGADDEPTKTTPMRFALACQSDCETSTTQRITFKLPNMRQDLKFIFFDCPQTILKYPAYMNWPASCVGRAASNVVAVVDPNTPLKPRIVPTRIPGTLRLQWSSRDTRPGVFARWGTVSGAYPNHAVDVTSGTYTAADMCAPPANSTGYRAPGAIHTAVLQLGSVEPGTRVYYVYGDGQATSSEYSLVAPPRPDAIGAGGTRLAIYADMGRGTTDDSFTWGSYGRPAMNTTKWVMQDVADGAVHAVAHFGDLSYATGYASVWDDWLEQISPLASQVAYAVNTGNHESDSSPETFQVGMRPSFYQGRATLGGDSGGECSIPTYWQWHSPREDFNTPWWSWDIGSVHIVAISTEYDFTVGSDQWLWLEADLASVNRTATPWVIFGAHRPMYISSNYTTGRTADQVVAQLMRDNLEQLTHKYGVDLAFYGHNHAVQRYCAAFGGSCLSRSKPVDWSNGVKAVYDHPPTTVHMLVGSAGAEFTVNEQVPAPEFVEWQDYFYGYARVHTANATHIRVQFVHNTDGQVLDDFVIIKDADHGAAGGASGSSGDDQGMSKAELGAFAALGALVLVVVIGILAMVYTGRCAAPARGRDGEYARMADDHTRPIHGTPPRTGARAPRGPLTGNPNASLGSPQGAELTEDHAHTGHNTSAEPLTPGGHTYGTSGHHASTPP